MLQGERLGVIAVVVVVVALSSRGRGRHLKDAAHLLPQGLGRGGGGAEGELGEGTAERESIVRWKLKVRVKNGRKKG